MPWSHCWQGKLGQALRKEGVRDVLGKGKPAVSGLGSHSPEEGGRGRSGGLASAARGWPSWECPALLLVVQPPDPSSMFLSKPVPSADEDNLELFHTLFMS